MKNMKNRFSDPDPDPDPLLPNMDPRIPIHFSQMWIRILIHVKMRWIRNAEGKESIYFSCLQKNILASRPSILNGGFFISYTQ